MSEAINNGRNQRIRKVQQPHGGSLNSGGTPGHKPGRGRPRNEIRQRMRDGLESVLAHVEDRLARPESLTMSEIIRAGDFLARYGLGPGVEVGQDDQPVKMYALTQEEFDQV